MAILLAEQNAAMALRFAQYGYVMESGRIVLDGDARTISENEDIKEFYLGLTGVGQRKSYRDVKHYQRRKRWLSVTALMSALVEIREVSKVRSAGVQAVSRVELGYRAGHDHLRHRPQRRRQDDRAQHDQRLLPPGQRTHHAGGARHHRHWPPAGWPRWAWPAPSRTSRSSGA